MRSPDTQLVGARSESRRGEPDDLRGILDTVKRLAALDGRAAGSDGERDAARMVQEELVERGRSVEWEEIAVRPASALANAAHLLLAIAGSVLSLSVPAAGASLILLAAALLFADVTGRASPLRLILQRRRRSQNLTSAAPDEERPARIVVTAHLDSARCGIAFTPTAREIARRASRLLPLRIGPYTALFALTMSVLATAIARLHFGSDVVALNAAQYALTVPLVVAVALLLDVAAQRPSPGADDNASGVALAIDLADSLGRDPLPNTETWFVFTGANEGAMLGMRRWLSSHRGELEEKPTTFVNLDAVGRGAVRFTVAEGPIVLHAHDRRTVSAAAAAAAEAAPANAAPLKSRQAHDSLAALMRGFPATTVTCRDPNGGQPLYGSPDDVASNVDAGSIGAARAFTLALLAEIDSRARNAAGDADRDLAD